MIKVAILVDGGFYKKRANFLFGEKSAKDRANELIQYCMRHLKQDTFYKDETVVLYRIFYYDCPPATKNVTHPLTNKSISLRKTDIYNWTKEFLDELSKKRKVAIRRGELLESAIGYVLKGDLVKKLCQKEITVDDLKESDFILDLKQKGVDMRIGLDIASLANKKLVDQIVLIAGDSDFVPAAKHARREGIDFILDPMWQKIKPNLNEHIDGIHTPTNAPTSVTLDKLSVSYKEIEQNKDNENFNAFKSGLYSQNTI